jgi:thymidine phosphorylase
MSNDTLQVRRIAIDTYHENVTYLHRECSIYRAEGFQALSKIQVSANGSKVLAVLTSLMIAPSYSQGN